MIHICNIDFNESIYLTQRHLSKSLTIFLHYISKEEITIKKCQLYSQDDIITSET